MSHRVVLVDVVEETGIATWKCLQCGLQWASAEGIACPNRAAEQRNEPDAQGQTCPSCGGAGYLRYQDTSARTSCVQCNGTGQV